jgi:hypothetical protein
MTRMAELEFQDNNTIPGMSDMAQTFLNVIKDRTDQSGIDLQFKFKERRREIFLEATIQFGRILSGLPIVVRIHSKPVGTLLNVGYAVTTEGQQPGLPPFSGLPVPAVIARGKQADADWDDFKRGINLRPENQRQLQITIDSWVTAVYQPTLMDLVAAAEARSQPRGGQGFLGQS